MDNVLDHLRDTVGWRTGREGFVTEVLSAGGDVDKCDAEVARHVMHGWSIAVARKTVIRFLGITCPGCHSDFGATPCCNHRCDGEWGTGCYHCHHPSFWAAELARREETYTTLDLICGVAPGSTSAAAADWHPDELPPETISYSNRSADGWPLRSLVVPNYFHLIAGSITAVEFTVSRGDGVHLAAAMRAAGYLASAESTAFDGTDKITARLRHSHSSTAGT